MLNHRLEQLTGRALNEPMKDAAIVAHATLSQSAFKLEDLDDQMAYIARYLRQPWAYLEEQTIARLNEMSASASRLVAIENGKGPKLDLRPKTEDNR